MNLSEYGMNLPSAAPEMESKDATCSTRDAATRQILMTLISSTRCTLAYSSPARSMYLASARTYLIIRACSRRYAIYSCISIHTNDASWDPSPLSGLWSYRRILITSEISGEASHHFEWMDDAQRFSVPNLRGRWPWERISNTEKYARRSVVVGYSNLGFGYKISITYSEFWDQPVVLPRSPTRAEHSSTPSFAKCTIQQATANYHGLELPLCRES